MMWNIFSPCVPQLFVCLPWETSIQVLCLFFNWFTHLADQWLFGVRTWMLTLYSLMLRQLWGMLSLSPEFLWKIRWKLKLCETSAFFPFLPDSTVNMWDLFWKVAPSSSFPDCMHTPFLHCPTARWSVCLCLCESGLTGDCLVQQNTQWCCPLLHLDLGA